MAVKRVKRPELAKPCGCNAKWRGALEIARNRQINNIRAVTPQGLYSVLQEQGWSFDQALGVWFEK